MSRLSTSFVLGYHGCDKSVATRAVLDGAEILQSDRDYDWLGPGAYFWESDPQRALEWARWKHEKGDYEDPVVIGAVIDLKHCLDLTNREDVELLQYAYHSFTDIQQKSGLPLPENKNPSGNSNQDRVLRYLDCAVFRHLHKIIEINMKSDFGFDSYDTVRGMFVEGEQVYEGSGIYEKSHVQIAVRNTQCIKGVFFPPDFPTEPF